MTQQILGFSSSRENEEVGDFEIPVSFAGTDDESTNIQKGIINTRTV